MNNILMKFSLTVRVFLLTIPFFIQSNLLFGNDNFFGNRLENTQEQKRSLEELNLKNDSLRIVELLEEAEVLRNKDLEEALLAFQNAYTLSKNSGIIRLMGESLNRLGATAMNAGLLELSVHYFLTLKELGEKEKNLGLIGNAEFNIGTIQVILEEYEEAKISLEGALFTLSNYYESVGRILPTKLKVNLKNNLGLCETGLGNNIEAINLFSEAIEIAEKNARTEDLEYYLALLNLAELHIKMNNIVAAERQLLKVETLIGGNNNNIITINSLRIKGKILLNRGDYKEAVTVFRQAYLLVDSQNNYSGLKHVSSDLSIAYENLGILDSALYFKDLSQQFEDEIKLVDASKQIMRSRILEEFNSKNRNIETSYEFKLRILIFFITLFFLLTFLFVYLIIKKSPLLKSIAGFNLLFPFRKSSSYEISDSENLNGVGDNGLNGNKRSDERSVHLNHSREKESLSSIFADLDNGKNKKIWKEFEIRLDEIDYQFYEKLLSEFPELTMNERRLAAFLKLQFSTKEISLLTGQSIRSIEVARSRLRKKLSITNSNQSLYDFFLGY